MSESYFGYLGYTYFIYNFKLNLPLLQSKCSTYLKEYSPYDHLVFALKNEGVNLLYLKKTFEWIDKNKLHKTQLEESIKSEPTGLYAKKIWFLYEWLLGVELNIPNLTRSNYVPLLDSKKQICSKGTNSKRHRVVNNLLGNHSFCPNVSFIPELKEYLEYDFKGLSNDLIKNTDEHLLLKASSFLQLKDSKASFLLEGEEVPQKRAIQWGEILGKAGSSELSLEKLNELQEILLKDQRFLKLGIRTEGGFIGSHEQLTSLPIPDHISAKPDDIESLLEGLLNCYQSLKNDEVHPVIIASIIAFGFVFIHPYEDGNGRIHRYLLHHILNECDLMVKNILFPISAVMLENIDEYKKVLESYSKPILPFIKWETTAKNNINVTNETIDFYRYFDATEQVLFIFKCIQKAIKNDLPSEINYISSYEKFKESIQTELNLPKVYFSLLFKFLSQGKGILSKRALVKEFSELNEEEVVFIEKEYKQHFKN